MNSGGKCHAQNYKINVARSRDIWGPYKDAPNNPILTSDTGNHIYGPGHNSVFQAKGDYYIAYHRQDVYHVPTCEQRQLCIDCMEFDNNGWIKPITPTHTGVDFSKILKPKHPGLQNVAFGKVVTSSGVDGKHNPELAVDNNYATYWIGGGSGFFSVDLGRVYEIEKIIPRFLYYDYHLLYRIVYSDDNRNWKVYHDQTESAQKAAFPITLHKIGARYVKGEFVKEKGNIALSELEVMSFNP